MMREVDGQLSRFAARLREIGRSELGQTLAEYGLITTIVAVGVTVLAMVTFRTALVGGFNAMSGYLTGGG
jgi:Flp pilus assembly pilin Flp